MIKEVDKKETKNIANPSSENFLLTKVIEEEKRSKDFGFYWESIDQILEQIKSECYEVKEAYIKNDSEHCGEEIGDLIHAAISLAFFCNHDPQEALEISFNKYQKRLNKVIDLAKQDGLDNLKNQSMKNMLSYWDKAKKLIDQTQV